MNISVIVPVYNVEKYVGKCIESILLQTYQNFELLLINDGSKDSSGEICEQYALQDDRIKVIHQKNKGVTSARWKGIENAEGNYIMFVDSDDYLIPEATEILMNEFSKNTDIDIALASMTLLWKDGSIRVISQPQGQYITEDYISMLMSNQLIWGLVCKLYKRKLFDNLPIVPAHIKIGEDLMMNLFVAAKVAKVKIVNIPIYFYRKLNQSTVYSVKYGVDYWKDYIKILSEKSAHYPILKKSVDKSTERLKLNISYHIISGGLKITDKKWIRTIVTQMTHQSLSFTENITLLMLKWPVLQSFFYAVYKHIKLRKL